MKWMHVLPLALGFCLFTPNVSPAADDVSCECPKLDCGPCKEEQGLTFYSEKCGPGGAQVKSCARPTCVAMADPPVSCNAKSEPASKEQPKAAVTKAVEVRGAEIAMIKNVDGSGWLKQPDGTKNLAASGMSVFEKDSILTEGDGKVFVEFKDGNLIQVQNNSAVKIDQYEVAAEKRKAVIDLLRGQLRNQVKQKYNGETTSYQIKTKTAVAGVRGTDFVVTFSDGEKLETGIQTLEGKVVLANSDYSRSIDISKGEQASYVVTNTGVFDEADISEFVARGYMTPVNKLTASQIAKINAETLGGNSGRKVAGAKKSICSAPKAELNQCAWKCVNNPAGAKTCQTDLPEVSCLRKRCNANGEWAEETRLPASYRDQCAPSGEKVAPCDY